MTKIVAVAVFALLACFTMAQVAGASDQADAIIANNLALAADAVDDQGTAYEQFKRACLAESGAADACLSWGKMAAGRGNDKDVKRALGSAIMLDPANLEGRYELALVLLNKQDWTWAIEHLQVAADLAADAKDQALLRYYLGYAQFKSGDYPAANKSLAKALMHLPDDLAQRANFYRGLAAQREGDRVKGVALLGRAQEGPNPQITAAAKATIKSWTAFPQQGGTAAQVLASLGVNTYPSVAFLDDAGTNTKPVLQSVFRGDLVVGTDGYSHGAEGMLTIYREQNWAELGHVSRPQGALTPTDMNLTLLMAQGAYVGRRYGDKLEHEVKLGVDTEMQLLDSIPQRNVDGTVVAQETGHAVYSRALGAKVWWSFAQDPSAIWGLRFKVEGRPFFTEEDRSTVRLRLRGTHTRTLLDRTLQLKFLLGGRYDRTYKDPNIIKFDRLLPEAWIDIRWKTPHPRITALVGGKVQYSWYMNSRLTPDNSFRPAFQAPGLDYNEIELDAYEKAYYDLARQDLEWEITLELQLRLWKKAVLAARYYHHSRYSNMDSAPTPMAQNPDTGAYERVQGATYGYNQDTFVLELKQMF